jgi:hypothetical protein
MIELTIGQAAFLFGLITYVIYDFENTGIEGLTPHDD